RVAHLVPLSPAAPLSLLLRRAALLVEPPRHRAARRSSRTPLLRANQRPQDELFQLLARVVEVLRLIARLLAHDQDPPLAVEHSGSERAEALFRCDVDHIAPGEIEAELDLGGHLVHVLPARPRRARRGPGEAPGRER